MQKIGLLVVIFNSLFAALNATSANAGAVILDDALTRIPIGRYAHYLADADGAITISDIRSGRLADRWKSSKVNGPGFGFTDSTYWVRFTAANRAAHPIEFLLEEDYPLINSVILYAPDGRAIETGNHKPYGDRAYDYRTFIFPLTIPAKSSSDYFLKFRTSSAMNIPLAVWSPPFFHEWADRESHILLLFNGIILVVALYNLLLFLIVRWKEYLLFSLLLVVLALFMGTQNGTAAEYLWPRSFRFATILVPMLLCVLLMLFMVFYINLFELWSLRNRARRRNLLWKAAAVLLGSTALLLASCFFLQYRIVMVGSAILAVIELMYVFILNATLIVNERNRQAMFAMAVSLPAMAGAVVYTLRSFSLLPTNAITEWSLHLGVLILALLFSLILADKIYGINKALTVTNMNLLEKDAEVTRHEERLFRYQFYDFLTDLPNRTLFEFMLQKEIFKDRKIALICIGIDKLAKINDLYGAAAADGLMKEIGARLKEGYFKKDVVARVDTDKFMVLLTDIANSDAEVSLFKIEKIARKTRRISQNYFAIDGTSIKVSTSIGMCMYPDDGSEPDVLIANCESAMNLARDSNSRSFQYFDVAFNEKMNARLKLERALADAIRNNELVLHYQPKVDTAGRIIGLEALVRWDTPGIGLVPPAEFIPMAENNGMIIDIGRVVFEMACVQSLRWRERGLTPPRIAVNLSPFQFAHPELLDDIMSIISGTGVDPGGLEIEITESGLMRDETEAIRKLRSMRRLGIAISIDDFGTGYSSLSKLKNYPTDTLKIDKSFVESIPHDKTSSIIASTIISLGHTLGVKVIAEGIETIEQLEFLRNMQCDQFQGYYFFKPLPPEEIEMMLTKTRADDDLKEYPQKLPEAESDSL